MGGRILRKNMIFDIGFHRGAFTLAHLNNADDKVVAIEANPHLYNEGIARFNNDPRVILLHYAAYSKLTTIPFYISNADTISTISKEWIEDSRFSKDYVWFEPINLPTITLDELIRWYGVPDLIKIDVEGAELDVVKGLSQKVNELCFEWAEESLEKINLTIEHLQSIGFTEFGYINFDNPLERPTNWSSWDKLDFNDKADPNRKETWGMIFAR